MNSRCAIAAWLECFQEKPSWCRNEQVCQGRKSVKRFEQSNGLDTALYKNIPLPFACLSVVCPIVVGPTAGGHFESVEFPLFFGLLLSHFRFFFSVLLPVIALARLFLVMFLYSMLRSFSSLSLWVVVFLDWSRIMAQMVHGRNE